MKEKEKILLSFYKKSLFLNGIFEPTGNNISPKATLKENPCSEYELKNRESGIIKFNSKKTFLSKDSYKLIEEGIFSIYENKEYILKNQSTQDIKTKKLYSATDNGIFTSSINLNEQFDRASINTGIFVRRFTEGINYGGTSIRDSLFKKLNHTNSFESLSINEYFILLLNSRLLHYSDNSNLFEIYETDLKSLKEGIENISNPKVYILNNKENLSNIKNTHESIKIKKKNLH